MFNINTILTKKVQIYLEAMINYRIAVTLHARKNIVRSLVQVLVNQLSHRQYNSCHFFILDWIFFWVISLNQTLCIKQGVSDLHWPGFALAMMFLHSFHLWKQADNKDKWDDKNLFRLLMFYIWWSWVVHHCCITSLFMFCINDFTLFYVFH